VTDVNPAGDYSVSRTVGDLVFTAGMTPRRDGVLIATGVLGRDVLAEDGRALASYAAGRALEAAVASFKEGDQLASIVSMTVFIATDPSFTQLSYVADGATERIRDALPESTMPVRAAIGVASLPGGAPVEVQLIGLIERDVRAETA
jgi:enamine deaminase RidA (YjgF/YER057c/UK114 family)